jgi:hypothetical protein
MRCEEQFRVCSDQGTPRPSGGINRGRSIAPSGLLTVGDEMYEVVQISDGVPLRLVVRLLRLGLGLLSGAGVDRR